ncbi:MAG: ParB-like protein [Hyphomicrobium sp.]|jgi:hypothetical protein
MTTTTFRKRSADEFSRTLHPALLAAQHIPPPRTTIRAQANPILLPLNVLRPTQIAVGMRAVEAKREKVETRAHKPRKIVRFLEERPIPAVRGPGEAFYIIDHHHLTLALWHSQVTSAFVEIIDDLSRLTPARFWRAMEGAGRVYLYDQHGRRVEPERIPRSINALKADPYRDLAWSVREDGAYRKTGAPYSEFRWAEFFRKKISKSIVQRNYDDAVAMAMKFARSAEASNLPGFRGK